MKIKVDWRMLCDGFELLFAGGYFLYIVYDMINTEKSWKRKQKLLTK